MPSSRILETRVKKVTRKIINFKLDASDSSAEIVTCSWDVLEPGDGALLEVVYVGGVVAIAAGGVIEGQVPIRRVNFGNEGIHISEWQVVVMFVTALVMAFTSARMRYRSTRQTGDTIGVGLMVGLVTLASVLVLIMITQSIVFHSIPFAF
jgi:hypothetical protein